MKKRIFSLAMVCLFVLTSLCSVPAFAEEGTAKVITSSEPTVLSAANDNSDVNAREVWKGDNLVTMGSKDDHYVSFDIDVKEAGTYQISVSYGYLESGEYQLAAYIDDTLAAPGIPVGSREDGTYFLGMVNLTEGTKTLKLLQVSYYAAMVQNIYIEAANPVSKEKAVFGVKHSTSYSVVNAWLGTNSKEGDYLSTEGTLEFGSSSYVNYDINVKEEGYYAFSMYLGTHSADVKYNFEVDGTTVISRGYDTAPTYGSTYHTTEYELPKVKLTKGVHKIKITFIEFTGWFYALGSEAAKANNVSYTEETILSAKNDVAFHSGYGEEDINASSGIINTDGRLKIYTNGKAYYLVNVPEAGKYNIGIIAASEADRPMKMTTASGSLSKTFVPKEYSQTYGTEFEFGTVELEKGLQVISFEVTNLSWGYLYLYGVTLKNAAHMLSTTDKVTVPACSFSSKVTSQEEVWPNDWSTDGIITKGLVVARGGYSYSYSINVPESGNYALSMVAGGGPIDGSILDASGNVLLSGRLSEATSNVSYASETESGAITLSKGINTITISVSDAATYLYSIGFEFIAPNIVVFEGEIADNMYAYEVVEGTMSFKAEMNGYLAGKNALVVFAIYETDENGVKKLYNAYAEIKEGGQTVMGAINDIVVDDEKTYEVKIFMLDSETLAGKCINYFEE